MAKTMEQLLAKIAAENRRDEEKRSKKKPPADKVATEAVFLKKWAKGKPIVRQSSDATFWSAGKWMTKMDFGMAKAIADAGLGTLSGDPRERGCRLVIN